MARTVGTVSVEAPLFMYLDRRLVQVGAAQIEVGVTHAGPRRTLTDLQVPIGLQDVPALGQE